MTVLTNVVLFIAEPTFDEYHRDAVHPPIERLAFTFFEEVIIRTGAWQKSGHDARFGEPMLQTVLKVHHRTHPLRLHSGLVWLTCFISMMVHSG